MLIGLFIVTDLDLISILLIYYLKLLYSAMSCIVIG